MEYVFNNHEKNKILDIEGMEPREKPFEFQTKVRACFDNNEVHFKAETLDASYICKAFIKKYEYDAVHKTRRSSNN